MVQLTPPPPRNPLFQSDLPLFLASYPKSGNTWARIFLGNYLADEPNPLALNDLRYFHHIADAHLFESWVGYPPNDLAPEQVTALRQELHGALRGELTKAMCYKVHDSFFLRDGKTRLFPAGCARVVYLLRNPLDVAVSLKHHYDLPDMDAAIDQLAGRPVAFGHLGRASTQMRQYFGNWSAHVRGWCDASDIEILRLRYEDLLRDPKQAFSTVLQFLRWPLDEARLARALEASRFERLRAEEQQHGFSEHYAGSSAFFRAGRAEGWRDHLSPSQVARLIEDHGEVMERFGYLGSLLG